MGNAVSRRARSSPNSTEGPMPHYPTLAVVWLDFHQAKIFLIKADDVEAKRVKADTPHRQIHHKAQVPGQRARPRRPHTISKPSWPPSRGVDAWLIVGPGGTKEGPAKNTSKAMPGS